MDEGRRRGELRIGDPEREQVMRMLGEHLSARRLDVHEYDERCRAAADARYRRDLDRLFTDLPEPRPQRAAPARAAQHETPGRFRTLVLVGAALLGGVLLMVRVPLVLVLIVVAGVIWWGLRR
ncbi:DUF1707 SHOCT-like domain-containing protein [Saccharopolyspora sp. CA-218241]|uniref:DUF1707 SHOCT-like domain-containing protein n=1 Tax=Saccharopolyspora sp. CA-218241 TaxID=3240027 RepID=UPI003D97FE2F